ncbi:hypothetical protein [Pedobacter helvus]|uniref:Secreted protein n=1 Tax=Pedobacter helvus TaxID=2563444 RepID=A0ABW9JLG2_9SPHI|nr:hypothetical protein [Pedobacter ureilyticus]
MWLFSWLVFWFFGSLKALLLRHPLCAIRHPSHLAVIPDLVWDLNAVVRKIEKNPTAPKELSLT